MDLVNWVIEESKFNRKIYLNGVLTTYRRFPPYNSNIIYDSDKYFKVTDRVKIYNRRLTENEWNHIVNVNKGLSFDGNDEYIDVSNKVLPTIETISPSGHNIIIDFESKELYVDNILYYSNNPIVNVYEVCLYMNEIVSDYNYNKTGIILRWARKNVDNLKRKEKTDYIVVDYKNIRYWINGIETKV